MTESNMTNKDSLTGRLSSNFQFSHKRNGICYYMAEIGAERTSGYTDNIPVIVPEKILTSLEKDSDISIKGQFRSRNQMTDGKKRLMLSVLASEMNILDGECKYTDINQVFLNGYICKEPTYRKTPRGRMISDVCLAVNRPYNHSDYLPCIFWGNNAKIVSSLPVGCQLQILGRIQSRIYYKKAGDILKKHTAYEVSVCRMNYVLPHSGQEKTSGKYFLCNF